ncbi:MAG: ATP synthase F1 subunit epsilon [Thermoflexaceae bacterium]|nr:ATP synthase F1 subunit epsilon [Thermoflexaceae bacterium]
MAGKLFQLKIISPDRVFYEGDVTMVEFTSSEGEMGVYADHVPLTTILMPGIMTIHEQDGIKKAALHAGFVEILQDKVNILAEVAEWPEEIDINRANEARIRAERRLGGTSGESNIDILRAELALKRSLTRIKLLS